MTLAKPRLPAAFPYVGGKWRLAKDIVPMIPEDHQTFVEVFCGSASVALAKGRSHIEVLNDVDGEVANFFEVVREAELRRELMERLLWTPYSRQVFAELCDMAPPADPVRRAWRFWAIARQCFGGYRPANNGRSFAGTTRGRWRRSISSRHCAGGDAATLHKQIDALDTIGERLRGVYVERKDFAYVLDRWDRDTTVFYCDPPYVGTEGYYDNGCFGAVRHMELANMLNRIRGRALVSYYPHESLEELYPEGRWRRTKVLAVKNFNGTDVGHTKPKRVELVLCNFDEEGRRL